MGTAINYVHHSPFWIAERNTDERQGNHGTYPERIRGGTSRKVRSDIANRIGSPGSAKEVSEACAANALAVAIPCHRVVKKDGALSGYRWGVKRKRALLEKEAHA
jgi:O-6-methylguanine DNA methyltransferase